MQSMSRFTPRRAIEMAVAAAHARGDSAEASGWLAALHALRPPAHPLLEVGPYDVRIQGTRHAIDPRMLRTATAVEQALTGGTPPPLGDGGREAARKARDRFAAWLAPIDKSLAARVKALRVGADGTLQRPTRKRTKTRTQV